MSPCVLLGRPTPPSLAFVFLPSRRPPRATWRFSPLLLAERRRRGVCKKVESVPDRPLALCRGSGVALANPAPAKPLTASTYQPENLGPDRAPGLRPARMRDDQTSRSITRGIKTSEAPPRPQGLHLAGALARTHRNKRDRERLVPLKKSV